METTTMNLFVKLLEQITQQELDQLEHYADNLLDKWDIDIEFTRHFLDRINDPRNKEEITIKELKQIFDRINASKGDKLKDSPDEEIQKVIRDLESKINIPVAISYKYNKQAGRKMFTVYAKTAMRKSRFMSSNPFVFLQK
jgi:CO dehydrogenase/acetyl-CoA synthase delta subunit